MDRDRQALATSTAQTSKAVLDAVKALPDHVKSELAAERIEVIARGLTKWEIPVMINANAYPDDLAHAIHINGNLHLDSLALIYKGQVLFSNHGDSIRGTLKEVKNGRILMKIIYANLYIS